MSRKLTVYFDDACPVCSREISIYKRSAGADDIVWIDASTCEASLLGPGLEREQALSRLHVRDANGSLSAGAPAFVALWRALPGFAFLARLASAGPVLRVMDVAYAAFLRLRPLWRAAKKASPPRPTTQRQQP